MKYQGLRPYRHKDNPEEKRFAQAWSKENEDGRLLAHLLDDRHAQGGYPPEPSDRDHVVAATVIQWLGSPVGQGFLRRLGYELNKCPDDKCPECGTGKYRDGDKRCAACDRRYQMGAPPRNKPRRTG